MSDTSSTRPVGQSASEDHWSPLGLAIFGVATVLLAAAVFWFARGLIFYQPTHLVVEPAVRELLLPGSADQSASATASFQVVNRSSWPIKLHGAESQCACVSTTSFPVEIGPGQSVPIRFAVTGDVQPGATVERRAAILNDAGQSLVATIHLRHDASD